MRRTLASVFFLAFVAATAGAQSGRRLKTPPPPPPPPPPPQESLSSGSTTAPLASVNGGALPEDLRTRQLQSLDNDSFRLADFSGKVIVINVWATWCGPCRREIPDYEKVRKEFAGREVEFIALTTEDPIAARDRVQKFAREYNFGFRIGWADRETARALMNGHTAIPQTLVIGSDGTIITHWTGYSTQGRERLRAAIEQALTAPEAQKAEKSGKSGGYQMNSVYLVTKSVALNAPAPRLTPTHCFRPRIPEEVRRLFFSSATLRKKWLRVGYSLTTRSPHLIC